MLLLLLLLLSSVARKNRVESSAQQTNRSERDGVQPYTRTCLADGPRPVTVLTYISTQYPPVRPPDTTCYDKRRWEPSSSPYAPQRTTQRRGASQTAVWSGDRSRARRVSRVSHSEDMCSIDLGARLPRCK